VSGGAYLLGVRFFGGRRAWPSRCDSRGSIVGVGLFDWLTERRRARLLEKPFPDAWMELIDDGVPIVQRLDREQRERLRDLVHVFVEEKHWEGCGGLELTDEHRVVIAAQACLLLLERDHDLYHDVESILVYPDTRVSPTRSAGFFDGSARVVSDEGQAILGEAHLGGPVILAWDDVLVGATGRGKRNVVFHEFAHKIDMADGTVDGTPPLDSRHDRQLWAAVCTEHFLRLREGEERFLDEYGATDEAEFFAVSTEVYFMQPAELKERLPDLYEVLHGFYRVELI